MTHTKELTYRGLTITRKEWSKRAYKRARGGGVWYDKRVVNWSAKDADGKFIRDRERGRTLRGVKRAIDRLLDK